MADKNFAANRALDLEAEAEKLRAEVEKLRQQCHAMVQQMGELDAENEHLRQTIHREMWQRVQPRANEHEMPPKPSDAKEKP